jgi:proteasome alpha subunit
MFAPPETGYDRAITIFSPDGRLFQVEYAIEAVRRGTTAIGLRAANGVVLAVEKRILSKLVEEFTIEKIFKIDEHIGTAIAGLTADARILINQARIHAQVNRLTYDEDIPVETLTRYIGDLKQRYTQTAGVRPFGVKLLIAGVDDTGSKLYVTDPSGTYIGYQAVAIGSGEQTCTEFLETEYKDNMDITENIKLALNALALVVEGGLEGNISQKVEAATIDTETRTFRKLTDDELKKFVDAAQRE